MLSVPAVVLITNYLLIFSAFAQTNGKADAYQLHLLSSSPISQNNMQVTHHFSGNIHTPISNQVLPFESRLRLHKGCNPQMLSKASCLKAQKRHKGPIIPFEYKLEVEIKDNQDYKNIRSVRFDVWSSLLDRFAIPNKIASYLYQQIDNRFISWQDLRLSRLEFTNLKMEISQNRDGKDVISYHFQGFAAAKKKRAPCYCDRDSYEPHEQAYPMDNVFLRIDSTVADRMNTMLNDPDFMELSSKHQSTYPLHNQ